MKSGRGLGTSLPNSKVRLKTEFTVYTYVYLLYHSYLIYFNTLPFPLSLSSRLLPPLSSTYLPLSPPSTFLLSNPCLPLLPPTLPPFPGTILWPHQAGYRRGLEGYQNLSLHCPAQYWGVCTSSTHTNHPL